MASNETIRKYESGAKKRKINQQKRERQADVLSRPKTPKLSTFFLIVLPISLSL